MNRLLYIGMDVHKESFTLSTYHVTLDESELTQDFIALSLTIVATNELHDFNHVLGCNYEKDLHL